jgi:hypothetical protein
MRGPGPIRVVAPWTKKRRFLLVKIGPKTFGSRPTVADVNQQTVIT